MRLSTKKLLLAGSALAALYASASLVTDFVHDYYALNGVQYASFAAIPGASYTGAVSGTGATVRYASDSSGNLIPFANNVLRKTDLGLLVEEARTNLLLWSQDLTQATWTKVRASITANATTAPDGTLTAGKLVEDTSTNTHQAIQAPTKAASAVAYVVTFYAKPAGRTWVMYQLNDGTSAYSINFDLANGVVGTVAGAGYTGVSASIAPSVNGWYKCTVVYTSTAIALDQAVLFTASANNTPSYTGDGVSGVYLWGFQKEQATFPTSYIPTTSAAVTRAADVPLITGLTAPSQGTLAVRAYIPIQPGVANQGLASVHDGTSNNRADLRLDVNAILSVGTAAGVAQWTLTPSGSVTASAPFRAAVSFAAGSQAATLNGTGKATASGASIGVGMTQLGIGILNNSGNQANGYTQSVALYPAANNAALNQ